MSFFRKKHPSASQLGSSTGNATASNVALNTTGGGAQIAQTPSQTLAQLKASQTAERTRDMGKENDA